MDPLFHFVFAILAAMAVGLHKKHRLRNIVLLAFVAVLIDVDHLLFANPRAFHNVFIAVLLPLVLFWLAFRREMPLRETKFQSWSLILMIILVSHVVADMFYGDRIALLYPLSETTFAFPSWQLSLLGYQIISPISIAMAVFVGLVALVYFVEDFIWWFEKKHKKFWTALRRTKEEVF